MGRGPAIFFTLCGFLVMNLVAIPGIQSGSRTIFALARDDLLPFSSVWKRISKRSQTPIAAVWIYAALEITVNLLGLASDTAISAVFNVCTVALNVSYVIPIACKLLYGRFERGPWNLGRWSTMANLIAVGWNGFMAVIFFFPTMVPVTPENVSRPPQRSKMREWGYYDIVVLMLDFADELRHRCVCVRHGVCGWVLVYAWPPFLHGAIDASADKEVRDRGEARGVTEGEGVEVDVGMD
jgi:amino acid transporter